MTRYERQRFQNFLGRCISSCRNDLTFQELRKQHNANDTAHWRKKQQKNESFSRNTICISCPMSYNQSDNSEHITNNKSICSHQQSMIVEDQDQKTTNQSSGLNNNSSTLNTIKSKSNKSSSTSSTNKLYFVLNNEKTSLKSTQNNSHSSKINIVPINDSHHKQQLSTLNKNQQQTKTTCSNHEKSSIQTSNRTIKTTTSISKPSRIPTTTTTANNRQRPPIPSITNQKTTNKSSRPPFTSTKPTQSFPSVRITSIRPQSGSTITKITTTTTTTNNNKPPISSIVRQSAHVLTAKQQNNNTPPPLPTIVLPSSSKINNVQHILFSKDTVKRIRTVRSHELKSFSNHLTPEILSQTNDSLSTLTPSSLESIINNKSIDNQLQKTNNNNNNLSSNISSDMRDFSEDSLNEHEHIQRLLKQNASINTTKNTNIETHSLNDTVQNENIEEEYFPSINNNRSSSSSLIKSRSISLKQKSLVHRLIFPQRLGRMIFYRRILSDSDIYQKLCSKDNETYHNVYHLDTIRDYSMEFYMLTSYTSDSELRAWIDSNDDEIVNNVCRMNNSDDDDDDEIPMKTIHSQDSLNQNEELDWYSELEIVHLPLNNQQENHKNISNNSNKVHVKELQHNEQFPQTTISPSSILSNNTSNKLYSTSLPSNINNETNLLLQEIFHASCTRRPSISNTIEQQTHIDQYDNDSTSSSSIITEEFKPDFYYLCPITNTTNFSKTDYKPLYHDF